MDQRRIREALERYRRLADYGRSLEPSPDTPGQARIREEHERRMIAQHGAQWVKENAHVLRAEWEYVKLMFLDTPEAVREHLEYLDLHPDVD